VFEGFHSRLNKIHYHWAYSEIGHHSAVDALVVVVVDDIGVTLQTFLSQRRILFLVKKNSRTLKGEKCIPEGGN
jgi:hypothetical protein